ncbi:uncharacterized protein K452DRAFT_276785 [Aplosporella prunicola CBS 121167]|uniref:Xylanolytic transcriptional activator regulatory domain-containing protein n=1 Tax=Aplosporella prunicola CBS 121167 TaxID=1176127 RepID=A0A6A6B3M5_9PEZI|nr:uncharacterized protein K452DRAFT_276785 [Aplosporella prunicola CBS 121167]KAF2138416.1 hypothetical protein K452DRAFT_276785 [Aplosporella prunicola CBS 121167]
MEELLSLLVAQDETSSRHTLPPSDFPLDAAKTVFTAKNLVDYASAYFKHFHHHCPLVHKATFELETAPIHLVLAIFFCGLIRVAPHHDTSTNRSFFCLGEDYIYGLLQNVVANDDGSSMENDVEIVQAALIMLFLQIASSDAVTRHRIRVNRHPELVASLRALGLMEAKRTVGCSASHWKQFITEEIRVRTATWVIAADCWCTLLFNNRPQITISEMIGDLPCAGELFEASTAAEFEVIATSLAYSIQSPPCLRDWVSSLMQETWLGPEEAHSHLMGLGHLQLCLLALNSVIFAWRTSLLISSSSHYLLRAMNRWKEHWDVVYARYTKEQVQAIGIARHSPETWTVARMLIEVAQSKNLRGRYARGIPTDSLKDFHEFIRLYRMDPSENDK